MDTVNISFTYAKLNKTIWLFREQLTKAGATEKLFVLFNEYLNNEGLIAHEGKMVDASFVEVPIQRNTRQENKDIKQGNVPEQWDENPHKLARKDTDARWTKKNGRSYYGYKNHIKADEKSKLIDAYTVTDASVNDSQETEPLLSEADKGQPLYADSAYSGEPVAQVVEQKEMINQIHEKGYRNNPLTEEQKESNRVKSKTRARIEHIFGFIENSMNGCGVGRWRLDIETISSIHHMHHSETVSMVSPLGFHHPRVDSGCGRERSRCTIYRNPFSGMPRRIVDAP